MGLHPVNPEVFRCIELAQVEQLSEVSQADLRPFLPVLVRSGILSTGDPASRPKEFRQSILVRLSDIEPVNSFVALLSVDYNGLEVDVKKELQLRQKLGNREQDSVLVQNLQHGLALEFERADATRKLRLVLSETLFIMSQVHEPRQDYYMRSSDLFDNWVYLEDVCDTLCIAMVELPNLLSLCDVCEAMLHVKSGPSIICRLVANMPDSFLEVCSHLISNGDKCEEESDGGLIRLEALRMLCHMNPSQSLLIRSRCVEQCRMPALTIFLSLESGDIVHNLIPFLSGILLGNDQLIRNWFSTYVRNGQKRKGEITSSLTRMREAIWTYLKDIMQEAQDNVLSEASVVHASSLLRLSCALKGIAGFKFQEDEINDLVGLVTLKAPQTAPGHRFVTLGLCTLLACPSLVSSTDHEAIIVEWIRSLLKKESEPSFGVNSSFEEILLLMAIHFHSNQLSAICDLVCATLGMKIAIRLNTMTRIKHIFVQQIFVEKVVAAHAVKVPVTENLTAELTGFLPVHCIYQLIKSRAFTKHQVPIKDWIYRQLMTANLPIHPVLPVLLDVYTQSVLVPGTSSTTTGGKFILELTNEPLSDDEVLTVYKDFQKKNLAPQLLVLYYVLLYEDTRLNNCRNLLSLGKKVKVYSPKLFSQIPIKYLLQEAQNSQDQSGGLFAPLLKLLMTHFPQLCIVNEWLDESTTLSNNLTPTKDGNRKKLTFLMDIFTKVYSPFLSCSDTPVDAIRLLNICKRLPPHTLWLHAKEIVGDIKLVIQPSVPRKIQDLFRDVWYLLNNVFPRHLWELTSNALLPEGSLHLNVDELTMDPLQILRCDPRVYRCAPIMSILLHILAASLAASKYYLGKHLIENPCSTNNFAPGSQSDHDREELKVSLIAVQDSAAIQILLEACLPNEFDEKGVSGELCLKEIQSLVCSFLHQSFISEPNLVKLIHFQGYPIQLLPVTVRGIPSMHICLDFIPELLNQPGMEKQVFALQLISYLSMQHSLPKSYNIAKLALTTISSMSAMTSEDRAEFYIPAVSALERLCEAFPPLVDEVVAILLNLGKICTSQNSVERNRMCKIVRNKFLLRRIHETYDRIAKRALLERKIF